LRFAEKFPELLKSARINQNLILVTRFAPPACLHILDPNYDKVLLSLPSRSAVTVLSALNLSVVPDLTRQAVPLSNPALTISGDKVASLPDFLGPEPPHTWCYAYIQAELARQQGNWEKVADLGDQAFAIPMLPDDQYEYLPFIEAYARLGRIKDARLLTHQVAESMPLLKPALCSLWSRLPPVVPVGTMEEIRAELEICPVAP
jgi:hypothetical protein